MKNPFKKEAISYKAQAPITPYQKAQKEWDEQIGSARVQAANWRILAFTASIIAIALLIIVIILLATKTEKIFVAEVTQSGRVVNIAPLKVTYRPSIAQKEYFVGQFIEMIRSLPLDPIVAKQNWLKAYSFLTQRASTKLNNYLRKNNPLESLGTKTVTVKITDVNPLSDSTLQIDWEEHITNVDGQAENPKLYSGVFTLTVKQPTTQQEILSNPLGIYIIDFNISQRTT